jgi:hypothetical protein
LAHASGRLVDMAGHWRPFQRHAVLRERRPLDDGVAGCTPPTGVPTSAMPKADDVSNEDLIRPEPTAVGAARRPVGDPLPARGLHQLAKRDGNL